MRLLGKKTQRQGGEQRGGKEVREGEKKREREGDTGGHDCRMPPPA